ncbi:hypothetical protein Murru_3324 [Allomuricauda ruestringensis DSM 13258]|uniref:Arm DNA-binding domain-containing protein n=1 Tax=Allomuricauda ruestringensis (strain DSM 13258 / CIP 107369 / LMG 19739 / B1) TaxID=886377 RepID=G2PMZ3_ALLRU|nr:Arm DNA-binding domain-containing protein [Allomuricauda ruestringensis]AEM72341.1 hypothetical protein Murru_3324 [Allomuricauda ruestringensis DSM 13258]
MLNSNILKVVLFTRDTSNNLEKLSIYAQITVNGKRAEISLKRSFPSKVWDNSRNRGRGGS